MRRQIATLAAMIALALSATPALAGNAAYHIIGLPAASPTPIVCGANTYYIVSGTFNVMVHEGTSATGNFNAAYTFTQKDIVVQDQNLRLNNVAGVERYGGTINATTGGAEYIGYLFKFQILGTADSLNIIWRISPSGADYTFGPGTCTP